MNRYNSKLLSHRLRGLAKFEHSRSSFDRIGELDITYFELDTRVSKDGVIYVIHNDTFIISGKKQKIACLTAEEIDNLNHHNSSELLPLSDALKLFSKHSTRNQFLCIDIKDYGFEKEHIDLVRKYQLEQQVIFITWIPQVIIRLQEIGTCSPLILSCWNISKLNPIGELIAHSVSRMARSFGQYIILGEKRVTDSLHDLSVGYQHALVCAEIPGLLLNILADSGGGICTHKSMYHGSLGDYCRINSIQLWLYNENDPKRYKDLADNDLVDVIFSDVAADISRQKF